MHTKFTCRLRLVPLACVQSVTNEEAHAAVAEAKARIAALKRRVQEAIEEEEAQSRSVHARILRVCGPDKDGEGDSAAKDDEAAGAVTAGHAGLPGVVDDLMIDYLLRTDREEVARKVAAAASSTPVWGAAPRTPSAARIPHQRVWKGTELCARFSKRLVIRRLV